MTVLQGVITLKALLDFVCAGGYAFDKDFPSALMFFGFFVADLGALFSGMKT